MSGGHGHIIFLALGVDHQENKFPGLVNELLHCFVVTKETAAGGGTSGILYNLFPKVTKQREARTHTQHVASKSMVGLIIHQKH